MNTTTEDRRDAIDSEATCPPPPRRSPTVVKLCSFSAGLDDMPRRRQASRVEVLRVLKASRRFSAFEASANQTIAKTMTVLVREKLIEVDNSPGYPWSNVKLTAAGEALIGEGTP